MSQGCKPWKRVKHRTVSGYMNCSMCSPGATADGPAVLVPVPDLEYRRSWDRSRQVSGRSDSEVRALNYFKGMTAREAARQLGEMPDHSAVMLISSNAVSPAVLDELVSSGGDHRHGIMLTVAGSPNLSNETMVKLIDSERPPEHEERSEYEDILGELAENPSASRSTLALLLEEDLSLSVSERMALREDFDLELVQMIDGHLRGKHHIYTRSAAAEMARNPMADTKILDLLAERYASKSFASSAMAIAGSGKASPKALDLVLRGGCPQAVYKVAGHRSTPEASLRKLALGSDLTTADIALRNPSTPTSAIDARKDDEDLGEIARQELQSRCAKHFDLNPDDSEAIDYFMTLPRWWEANEDSPEVFIARTVFPRRED